MLAGQFLISEFLSLNKFHVCLIAFPLTFFDMSYLIRAFSYQSYVDRSFVR